MPTVVVCDDDAVLRATVSTLCADAGLEVVAETDSGRDAAELVQRFGVDVLILDLSLVDGSGEVAITALAEEQSEAVVLVFTAYAGESQRLIALGASQVIQKPDFERLGEVLAQLADSTATPLSRERDERRRASRPVDTAPSSWRSPSGISPRVDLAHSVLTTEPGDAVLAVTIVGMDAFEADVGPRLVEDCRLAVARHLRRELRVQDLLHEAPEIDGFVALVRGGDERAAAAVWTRLAAVVRQDGLPGELHGATARIDKLGATDAIARTIAVLRGVSTGGPSIVAV